MSPMEIGWEDPPTPPSEDCEALCRPASGAAAAGGAQGVEDTAAVITMSALLVMV